MIDLFILLTPIYLAWLLNLGLLEPMYAPDEVRWLGDL